MVLYFTNNSKQKKILIQTDYIEDIYDEVIVFLEEHHIYPHFIKIDSIDRASYQYVDSDCRKNFEQVCRISFGSYSEYFYCEGITDMQGLKDIFRENSEVWYV